MPTVMLLGASISQLTAIERAHADGMRVVAVDGDPDAVGFPFADVVEAVDFSDVDAVTDIGRRHHVDAVLAVSTDRAVPVAATVAERLGLPGIGPDVARRMSDKAAMREALAAGGVPQPAYAVVDSAADAAAAVARVGLPAVVKPVDSGGQRGISRVDRAADAEAAVAAALAFSRRGSAIVESYVHGTELNGIVVVRDGVPRVLTLSDRLRPDGPGFGVGWAHCFPTSLPPDVRACAAEVATAVVGALGLRDGIAFPQLLVAEDGEVVVGEVAARIPAGQMADLVRHGIGVDLYAVAFCQACGTVVPDELTAPRFVRPLGIRFLTAQPGPLSVGVVRSVEGLDRVRAAPGVLAASLYLQVGETIRPVRVDADRRGYVIATAADPAEALALADGAVRELVVVTA